MAQPTKATVEAALKTCIDPELGIDIVLLGLIYDIAITGEAVTITMTLTTPGCPLAPYFRQKIESAVRELAGANTVTIDLTFDPPWSPDRLSAEAKRQLTMLRG